MSNYDDLTRILARGGPIHRRDEGWVSICCPWHNDRHPSFTFNEDSGVWECWSKKCAAGAGYLSDLIPMVKSRFGIEYKPRNSSGSATEWEESHGVHVTHAHRRAFLAIMEAYESCFTAPEGQVAREYLEQRKLDVADFHAIGIRVGFAPTRTFIREFMPRDEIPLLHEMGISSAPGPDVQDLQYFRLVLWSQEYTWAQGRALWQGATTRYLGLKTTRPFFRTRGREPFGIQEGIIDAATMARYGLGSWILNGKRNAKTLVELISPIRHNAYYGLDADLADTDYTTLVKPVCAGGWINYHGHKDANACHVAGIVPTLEEVVCP